MHGLAKNALQELAKAGYELVDVQRLRIEGLAACKGEQSLRQGGRALGAGQRVAQEPRLLRRNDLSLIHIALRNLDIADDDRQQIVEVVRNTAGKLADGFELLHLKKLFASLFQFLLRFARLRHVARDFGEADDLTRLGSYGID